MPIHRPWRLALSIVVAAMLAAPTLAQQPPATPDATTPAATPPAAPAPAKKKPKPKPAAAPTAATEPAAAAPEPAKKKPKPKPAAATAATAPAAAAPAPPPGPTKPTLLGQYGDWGAYAASPGGKKVCFAIAKPSSSETIPANRPRNPTYMFVSSRPADKVSNQVSIIIGYPFKPSTEATLAVGTASFALLTQQDGAWVKDEAEEGHLVDALRTGQSAVVKGMSSKGTRTTDIFSLRGLSQALDRTDQDCK